MGRPRSSDARKAILDAAFQLLVERGYEGLALEAIAAKAGTGKTTIYRWWTNKAELAVDAFFHATQAELTLPNSASAREDFCTQIGELAALLRGARGHALAAMLGASRTDPDLAKALAERWLIPRRRWGIERMQRAAEAGQLNHGVTVDAALSILYGPLYAPLLFGGEVPDQRQVDAYLDAACRGIFRPSSGKRPPKTSGRTSNDRATPHTKPSRRRRSSRQRVGHSMMALE